MTAIVFFALATLVAVQAAPASNVDGSSVLPMMRTMPELDDALKYPDGRIINGQPAARGQFPYQVSILSYSNDGIWGCGGSLISDEWILTAAHCLYGFSSFSAHLGVLSWYESESGAVILNTTNRIIHPEYNPDNNNNDIALLRLPSPVTFSSTIQPVNLPSSSQASNDWVGQTVRVSGWGRVSDSSSAPNSKYLNFVDLTILSNSACALYYYAGEIISSSICTTGANGSAPCNGDSGGPLVVVTNSSFLQIGVVSFVRDSCSTSPTVYTRVTSYLSWISENTGIAL